jgi:hypothetical protein
VSEGERLRRQRAAALGSLVSLARPIGEALAALSSFPWDFDEELVTFTRSDALNALRMFLAQELKIDDLRQWAEALDGRDDLAFEPGFEDELREFIFKFSTPEINEQLTFDLAARWASRLS